MFVTTFQSCAFVTDFLNMYVPIYILLDGRKWINVAGLSQKMFVFQVSFFVLNHANYLNYMIVQMFLQIIQP